MDVAADAAVVNAARAGLSWARDRTGQSPWLMVSVSDGRDAHFRKAVFDPSRCPPIVPAPARGSVLLMPFTLVPVSIQAAAMAVDAVCRPVPLA